jgi:hypothetical protein
VALEECTSVFLGFLASHSTDTTHKFAAEH